MNIFLSPPVLIAATGVLVWGVLQSTTKLLRGYGKRWKWYANGLRLLSMLLGALIGGGIYVMAGEPAGAGVLLGACSGALSTYIVYLVKLRAKQQITGSAPAPQGEEQSGRGGDE